MAKKLDRSVETSDPISSFAVEMVPIQSLNAATYNPRKISREQMDRLVRSIREWGFVDPIVANRTSGSVVGGHQRLKAAKQLGMETVPTVWVELDDVNEKALNIALNKHGGEWDYGLLQSVLDDVQAGGIELELTGFTDEEWETLKNESAENDGGSILNDVYTAKVESPIYEVTGKCPNINELYDKKKAKELKSAISKANIPKDVSEFLEAAADRHTVFNYKNIAEYYAHAPQDVQELMEQSALIIIDYNKAIELGFVKLCDDAAAQFIEEYGDE